MNHLSFNRIMLCAFCAAVLMAGNAGSVQRVSNGFRGGESIHRLSIAEPLGPGGFQYGVRIQFQRMEVDTTNFDLRMNIAYGLFKDLDFCFYLPYYRMTRGEFNKYGPGDAVASVRYTRRKFLAPPFTAGVQFSALIPSGFSREYLEFPSFTIDQIGFGARFMLQLNSNKVLMAANAGVFGTEKNDFVETFIGAGAKVNLLKRLLMAACEFTQTYDYDANRAQFNTFVGLESHLPYIGLGLMAGVDYDAEFEESVGLALGATITSRKILPGVSRGILETEKRYRNVMLFEFLDEKEEFTLREVKERLARNVGSLDGITVMEPPVDAAQEIAAQDREGALQAAGSSGADLLFFCRYHSARYERSRGYQIPYLIGLPRTSVEISADVWVVDTKLKRQIYSKRITAGASKLRGVTLFPTGKDEQKYYLDAFQREKLRQEAVDHFVKSLSVIFSDKFE